MSAYRFSSGSGFGGERRVSEFKEQMKREGGPVVIRKSDVQSRLDWLEAHGEPDPRGVMARHAVIVD